MNTYHNFNKQHQRQTYVNRVVLVAVVVIGAITAVGVMGNGYAVNQECDTWECWYFYLLDEYNLLLEDYNDLAYDYDELYASYNDLAYDYYKSNDRLSQLRTTTDKQFLTTIEDSYIHWDFYDSKGNPYSWNMPISTYEDEVAYSDRKWEQDDVFFSVTYSDGDKGKMRKHHVIVEESFSAVIDEIYENSKSNTDFIREVWWIVGQMTIYEEDVGEWSYGRHALETFTRQGGDCEDMAILIADMLKSSKYTNSWSIKMWYIDTKNVNNPQSINHVIVVVNDGQYRHVIEPTAGTPDWSGYYPNSYRGWSFEVNG